MGIFDIIFGKKNHSEQWIKTPQEMKEKSVVAYMEGYLPSVNVVSKSTYAVIKNKTAAFINIAKDLGVIKQIADEITSYYKLNINESDSKAQGKIIRKYFEVLRQAQREGKRTGLPSTYF